MCVCVRKRVCVCDREREKEINVGDTLNLDDFSLPALQRERECVIERKRHDKGETMRQDWVCVCCVQMRI